MTPEEFARRCMVEPPCAVLNDKRARELAADYLRLLAERSVREPAPEPELMEQLRNPQSWAVWITLALNGKIDLVGDCAIHRARVALQPVADLQARIAYLESQLSGVREALRRIANGDPTPMTEATVALAALGQEPGWLEAVKRVVAFGKPSGDIEHRLKFERAFDALVAAAPASWKDEKA